MKTSAWKVIVVEDTYDDQQVVSYMLRHHGIEVHIAHNGEQCLEMLNMFEPTCIVTDLDMPIRDGWQTLSAVRAEARTAHIPIIAITAYHATDVAESAIRAGFDGYFPKPLNPQTFVSRLQEIVQV
ncbi:MAG: response regulator [Chloroflexi bacterium]|jgi:two-component system cell cycle response regulator DivK|uniref:response regulator n=1 Tax=Candidatus Flexifilum breve TaxID=3140694 RepID=UPI003135BFF6|nr:response regulator [Chloroflexota bacterium]